MKLPALLMALLVSVPVAADDEQRGWGALTVELPVDLMPDSSLQTRPTFGLGPALWMGPARLLLLGKFGFSVAGVGVGFDRFSLFKGYRVGGSVDLCLSILPESHSNDKADLVIGFDHLSNRERGAPRVLEQALRIGYGGNLRESGSSPKLPFYIVLGLKAGYHKTESTRSPLFGAYFQIGVQ